MNANMRRTLKVRRFNNSFPIAHFENKFTEKSGQTEVNVITQYESQAHLARIIKMGVKEGLTAAFENLDEVLKSRTA